MRYRHIHIPLEAFGPFLKFLFFAALVVGIVRSHFFLAMDLDSFIILASGAVGFFGALHYPKTPTITWSHFVVTAAAVVLLCEVIKLQ